MVKTLNINELMENICWKNAISFCKKGVKTNAKYYQEHILCNVIVSKNTSIIANGHINKIGHQLILQISLCINLFSNVLNKEVWSPNLPDLNPWSILESFSKRHTITSLKPVLLIERLMSLLRLC